MDKVRLLGGALMLLVGGSDESIARGAANEAPPSAVHIGIVKTLFRGTPEPLIMALMQPFGALMKAQTGLQGDLISAENAYQLARMLEEDQLQIGVFHGIEFAWAKQKYPNLRPLMLAVNRDTRVYACLVVQAKSDIRSFADLKGKRVALWTRSHEHCRLFFERGGKEFAKGNPQAFVSTVKQEADLETTLDDVIDGSVQAAVVEHVFLKSYARRKPERFKLLKVAVRSDPFPASVVVYREGRLNPETILQFREGMIHANTLPLGRKLLMMWQLTGFSSVPTDYAKTVNDILKIYPPPPETSQTKVLSTASQNHVDH